MARIWKDHCSAPIGGLLIDTLAYNFMEGWAYKDKSYAYYDWMMRDFLMYLKNQSSTQNYWLAPGSARHVYRAGNFEYKALVSYNIAVFAVDYESKEQSYSASLKWKEIFGNKFTG